MIYLLLAEDEIEQQLTIEDCIEDCLRDTYPDISFQMCGDGDELLEKLMEKKPQLIILDINMPMRDGVSTLRAIKEDPQYSSHSKIPVVMLSSSALEQAECLDLGAEAYYEKADDSEGICEQLKEIVEHHAAQHDPFSSFPGDLI